MEKIKAQIRTLEVLHCLSSGTGLAVAIAPIIIIALYSGLLWNDGTNEISRRMLIENNPVELATFVFLTLGSVQSMRLFLKRRASGQAGNLVWFYAVFSVSMLFVAMEEISWAQWFFAFETPGIVANSNAQGELNLHNLKLWHDYIEALPMMFGLGGLFGIGIARTKLFSDIAPSILLAPWFMVIAAISAIDLYHEYQVHSTQLFAYVNHLDELIEMFVGVSGFLYVWLNSRGPK
ncbi:MAG: hypothetical protein HOM16_07385 [Woeseia sp.]|nr:hypothetical protein [Woeseia sp.]